MKRRPVLLAALALALPAGADAKWSAPARISDDEGAATRIAMAPDGEAVVVWGSRFHFGPFQEGGPHPGSPTAPVQAAIRPAGGAFGPQQAVSSGRARLLGMRANALGDALVEWAEEADPPQLLVNTRVHGGAFGSPFKPLPGVGAPGLAGATVWTSREERDDGPQPIDVVTRSASGELGPVREVARPRWSGLGGAAVAPTGETVVAWLEFDEAAGRGPRRVMASVAPPGGDFGPPVTLSSTHTASGFADNPVVRANRRGDFVVAWGADPPGAQGGGFSTSLPRLAFRPAGGSFGPEESTDADALVRGLYRTDIALGDGGDVALVWSNARTTAAAYRPAGGRLEPAVRMPTVNGLQTDPAVALDAAGTATFAWADGHSQDEMTTEIMAMRRPREGPYGPPELVARSVFLYEPDVGTAADGETAIVWTHHDDDTGNSMNQERGVEVSYYVPDPPVVSAVALKRSANALSCKLSEPARVTMVLKERGRGRAFRAQRTFKAKRGSNLLRLDKKLRRKLRRGRLYVATFTARDAAGDVSKPRRLEFRWDG
jgi:hypothetical protein